MKYKCIIRHSSVIILLHIFNLSSSNICIKSYDIYNTATLSESLSSLHLVNGHVRIYNYPFLINSKCLLIMPPSICIEGSLRIYEAAVNQHINHNLAVSAIIIKYCR